MTRVTQPCWRNKARCGTEHAGCTVRACQSAQGTCLGVKGACTALRRYIGSRVAVTSSWTCCWYRHPRILAEESCWARRASRLRILVVESSRKTLYWKTRPRRGVRAIRSYELPRRFCPSSAVVSGIAWTGWTWKSRASAVVARWAL